MSVSPVSLVSDPQGGKGALAELLDDLADVLAKYVAFPSHHDLAATAAWIVHAHAIDAYESTPRLAVLSAEKGSGKTRTMELVELLVPNPLFTVNISPAALFRKLAEGTATVLLDEADTYLSPKMAKEHEDLRGLVNAGHRRGAVVYRAAVTNKGVEVNEYPAFAAIALAGIGDLPDTILDRSVVIAMKRRAPHEQVANFRRRQVLRESEPIRERLTVWAADHVDHLARLEPTMPDGITDRPADVWEPLIMVGDYAGAEWSRTIREAAQHLNGLRAKRDPSLGIRLLADCREVFDKAGTDRLTSLSLVTSLVNLEEAPWGDLRGSALDARGLARRLKAYEVRPTQHRFGEVTAKGYLRADFHDAWLRYLPPVEGNNGNEGDAK